MVMGIIIEENMVKDHLRKNVGVEVEDVDEAEEGDTIMVGKDHQGHQDLQDLWNLKNIQDFQDL